MLVPIKWLYEFVPCDKSPKDLAELFTLKGVEVKNITRIGEKLEGFIIVEVKTIKKNKVTLFDGKNNYEVNTITYHLKPGNKIGFNPINSRLVNPELIEASEDTLPYILEHEYRTGSPVLNYVDDYILDLEIMPNRGDLMSIIGIARELASYEEISQKYHEPAKILSNKSNKYNISDLLKLNVMDKEGCPDYIARLICDVKIMPSSFWLQWRLLAVGLRPINNIVDATNYIMVKYGTPLHAFDYDKVTGQTIQVRFAKKGEKVRTIDKTLINLNEKVLLITDQKFPVAIAGIMGGIDSEISISTKRVLLECARFNPKAIRRGSKSISIATEASQRFEMGIDSEILEKASLEVSNLIAELGNGVVAKSKLEARTQDKPVDIKICPIKTSKLIGVDLEKDWVKKILIKLNCKVTDVNGCFKAEIPSYRLDLRRDVDLIEEIARIYGYDKLPSVFSLRGSLPGSADNLSRNLTKVRNFFTGLGFIENYTVSFCDEPTALEFTNHEIVKIPNPLNERYAVLRPSILTTLLDSVKINYSRGNKNLRLFEIGKAFNLSKGPKETTHVAAVILGETAPTFWQHNKTLTYDYFDIKGITESFLDNFKVKECHFKENNVKCLATNNAVSLIYADKQIGYLGEIRKQILDRYDIPITVYALEINLEEVLNIAPSYRYFQTLPRFPSVVRDLAFIIDDKLSAAKMTQAILKIAGALLESVEIFDYFAGKPLPTGKRNLGIRITLRSEERTLNQAEVNKIFDKLLKFLKDKMQVELRGEDSAKS
jgi:phenylalanyl-tRNA synthetase beta chain